MARNVLNEEGEEFYAKCAPLGVTQPQILGENFKGKMIKVEGRDVIDMTRLDYLSLGSSPQAHKIIMGALGFVKNISCPASQMIFKSAENLQLERELAEFHGVKSTVVFTSGYATNENIMRALGERMHKKHFLPYRRRLQMGGDTANLPTIFFVDRESHASLKDGIKIAKSLNPKLCYAVEYRSGDFTQLEELIEKSFGMHGEDAVRIIVTDALSSSTGKVFDVNLLGEIATKYGCWIYVDEAHSVGVFGDKGQGIAASCKSFASIKQNMIIMGTLTKTFCTLGGYIAMHDKKVCAQLQVGSEQYIFSSPIPPWQALAAAGLLKLTLGTYGEMERRKLREVSKYFRQELVRREFEIMGSESHIVPALVREDEKARAAQAFLLGKGFAVAAFTDHSVPRNSALLRSSFCSDITLEEAERLTKGLVEARDKFHLF